MKLSTLLTEIRESSGPVTGIELADRLGLSPAAVARMLVALRATGQIGPEVRTEPAPEACASSGTCSMSCPGPEECSLVIDLRVTGLEVRTPTPAGAFRYGQHHRAERSREALHHRTFRGDRHLDDN